MMTSLLRGGRPAREAEHPLPDDVALDLVGAREDRRRLVVEPRALPDTVARVVGGALPPGRRDAEPPHGGGGQSLGPLAPVELERAALGPRLTAPLEPRQGAPVVELEQAHLD